MDCPDPRPACEGPHTLQPTAPEIEGLSQKVLSQTLKRLERDGLVSRAAFATVPVTVEYAITPLGKTLVVPLNTLQSWAETHIADVLAAHRRYDRR